MRLLGTAIAYLVVVLLFFTGQKLVAQENFEPMALVKTKARAELALETMNPTDQEEPLGLRTHLPDSLVYTRIIPVKSAIAQELFARFNGFMIRFHQNHGNDNKADFLQNLFKEFTLQESGKIVLAMTAFGEAGARETFAKNLGDMGAVVKVIRNRSRGPGAFKRATVLGNLGLEVEATNADLFAALADYQFSIWNDDYAHRLIGYRPQDAEALARMEMAFITVGLYFSGKILYGNGLENSDVWHYHNNHVSPNWADDAKKLEQPLVRVVLDQGKYEDVFPSSQNDPFHYFYRGIR